MNTPRLPLILSLSKDRAADNLTLSFYVYILRCSNGSYYTGHTDDLEKRLEAHKRGAFSGYTQNRRPAKLIFAQDFASRDEAFARERQIKGWSRRKKEALIQGNWDLLPKLAKTSARPFD